MIAGTFRFFAQHVTMTREIRIRIFHPIKRGRDGGPQGTLARYPLGVRFPSPPYMNVVIGDKWMHRDGSRWEIMPDSSLECYGDGDVYKNGARNTAPECIDISDGWRLLGVVNPAVGTQPLSKSVALPISLELGDEVITLET
jgi:hypothetical protein